MAITEDQRITRKKYLGSSEISALFTDNDGKSLNPFANSVDVYNSKVYDLEDMKENDAIKKGNRYERALIDFASEQLGCKIETDPAKLEFIPQDIIDKNGNPFTLSHPDGFTVGAQNYNGDIYTETAGIEAKTTSMSDEWDNSSPDGVPFRVHLQAQHQMMCTGWNRVYIPVLLGRFRLTEELFMLERNEQIIDAIKQRITQFWNDNVLDRVPPKETEKGNIEVFKRIVRTPGSWATINPDLILAWEQAKEEAKEADKVVKSIFADILTELGDAEGVQLPDGRVFTYFEQSRSGVDTKKLQQEFPDAFKAVQTTSTFRVARIKKGA